MRATDTSDAGESLKARKRRSFYFCWIINRGCWKHSWLCCSKSGCVFVKSEIFGFVVSVWCTAGNASQWKRRAVGVSSHLFLCVVHLFVLSRVRAPIRTCTKSFCVCVCLCLCSVFSGRMLRVSEASARFLLLRLKVPHFSVPFAEVDAVALHTGWASIILSYCKVICIQTKLRKSNLSQERQINLGGRGPRQCTAGAKLAWLHLFWCSGCVKEIVW